ncbi:Replication protein A 70 kDa DNA-binding subunit [Nosema granulosis]|uniref:Replication protein A subunit n=1 Tax=Nosema granulosis TaxID=83296 RepID=A0A9P6H0P5_9MICR|nr:Replication protein A 70 kDa DNA-binding subunit [Nosema granulosis]
MKIEEGTVEVIFNSQKKNPLYEKPVLQIVSLQKIGSNSGEKFRYRANLSDGRFYIRSVFSSDLTNLFDKNLVSKYSLIRFDRFCLRSLKENNYLYIQEIKEYEKCNVEVGHPVNIETGKMSLNEPTKEESKPSFATPLKTINKPETKDSPKRHKQEENDSEITPINAINPFHNKWVIKGNVVLKSDIRKYSNKKGEGKLFSFEIADESGQIKVAAFQECVDIFFPLVEIGKTYTIRKGFVKMANKQYTNNNSDYEIHLDKNSEISSVDSDGKPSYCFNFVKIKDVATGVNSIDFIGVVKDAFPATTFIVKSTQKEQLRRDLILVDETGSIKCTFWGQKAEIEIASGDVLAIKSIRPSDFGGVSLSSAMVTQVLVNPDIPESHAILGWYQDIGKDMKVEMPEREQKISLISDIKNEEMVWSAARCTIVYFKEDSIFYESCKSEGCNKKVIKNDIGEFRCERCNKTSYECNYRYMTGVVISDFTGQIWTTLFDEQAFQLFGIKAEQFKEMALEDASESQAFIRKFIFKDVIVRLKSRQDTYNDELRMRYNITDIKPIKYIEEIKKDLSIIEKCIFASSHF